jgi:hypothetical protein
MRRQHLQSRHSELNSKPNKFYQQSVLLQKPGSRASSRSRAKRCSRWPTPRSTGIFVRAPGSIEAGRSTSGSKIEGTLVPEARVGGKLVYDIVMADSVTSARAPLLRNLF